MSTTLDELWTQIEALIVKGRATSSAVHALLHPDGALPAKPPAAVPPLPVQVQPVSGSVAKPSAYPIVTGVHGTEWLNASDDRTGETAKQPMYTWAPRNYKGCGLITLGVALPCHVLPGDGVRVRRSGIVTALWFYFRAIEGGPHRTNDDYLTTGNRPLAEATDANHAGIDFTPAAIAQLLGKTAQQCYDGEESVTVDVQFVPAAEMPDDAHLVVPAPTHINGAGLGEEIVVAARTLPEPFPYAPETKGGNLGCADVVSTALRNAGVPIPIILGVDDVVAALHKLGWPDVGADRYVDGCVIVWAPTEESGGHKHIGILAHRDGQLTAINNSSSQRKVLEEILATKGRPIERVLEPAA